jgi:hypothetical protein
MLMKHGISGWSTGIVDTLLSKKRFSLITQLVETAEKGHSREVGEIGGFLLSNKKTKIFNQMIGNIRSMQKRAEVLLYVDKNVKNLGTEAKFILERQKEVVSHIETLPLPKEYTGSSHIVEKVA